jgi:hypothetical protein
MKKCSTSGWDREARQATGCPYVMWLTANKKGSAPVSGNEPPPPTEYH